MACKITVFSLKNIMLMRKIFSILKIGKFITLKKEIICPKRLLEVLLLH